MPLSRTRWQAGGARLGALGGAAKPSPLLCAPFPWTIPNACVPRYQAAGTGLRPMIRDGRAELRVRFRIPVPRRPTLLVAAPGFGILPRSSGAATESEAKISLAPRGLIHGRLLTPAGTPAGASASSSTGSTTTMRTDEGMYAGLGRDGRGASVLLASTRQDRRRRPVHPRGRAPRGLRDPFVLAPRLCGRRGDRQHHGRRHDLAGAEGIRDRPGETRLHPHARARPAGPGARHRQGDRQADRPGCSSR